MILQSSQWANEASINLPSSKSISNRVLIIRRICQNKFSISNLSDANDTVLLQKILSQDILPTSINAEDAGTAYRFLTAYLAFQESEYLLLGTNRMYERPIEELVDALTEIGAEIKYLEKEKYPPLAFKKAIQKKANVSISGHVSSQFISALLLIAPTLPLGLELEIKEPIVSIDYIQSTLEVMKYFDINIEEKNNHIKITNQQYKAKDFLVEADWSSAAFFYAWICDDKIKKIQLNNLFLKSEIHQADSIIHEISREYFQIETRENKNGIELLYNKKLPNQNEFSIDIKNCPDLAPALIVMCVLQNKKMHLTGTEHLRSKESDRGQVMKDELSKLGVKIQIEKNDLYVDATQINYPDQIILNSYKDHRIAMALAALNLCIPKIEIQDAEHVKKSFPNYWIEVKKLHS